MKWLAVALLVALAGIHYRLWISGDGVRELGQLRDSVATQRAENERLTERNRQLAAEVRDLKQGFTALEERARSDLGMISQNETYYQVVPPEPAATQPADTPTTRTAAR
ncbi:MAG: cell division protein FtsB [Steroidobacteraceae bacterium]